MRSALVVLALLAPLSAGAEALPPPDHAREFRSMDVDGDGHVSLSEAAGNGDIVGKFERADRDQNGKLSLKEFEALRGDKLPKKMAKVPTTKTAMAKMQSAATGGTAAKKGGKKPEKKAAGG
jgi:hypothetical protein